MGKKPIGETPKMRQVNLRLDEDELAMLKHKSARRGLGASTYLRTLVKEDPE